MKSIQKVTIQTGKEYQRPGKEEEVKFEEMGQDKSETTRTPPPTGKGKRLPPPPPP
jgi:hypothetical protein